jgi:hypothetical protein
MSKHKSDPKRSGRSRLALRRRTLLAAGVVGALGGGYLLFAGGAGRAGRSFSVQGGERRPVLDPLQFSDARTRQAYMAAARHPDVLDQVFCYCGCEKSPFLHKSLLSCFATQHGAG